MKTDGWEQREKTYHQIIEGGALIKDPADEQRFNLIDVLGFAHNEDFHGRFLAAFLRNPGQHGFGSYLLDRLFYYFQFDFEITEATVVQNNIPIPPTVEEVVLGNTRIDNANILIHDPICEWAIFIITKIEENDPRGFIYRLFQYGYEHYDRKKVAFVYLTPEGTNPYFWAREQPISHQREGDESLHSRIIHLRQIKILSYRNQVLPWFREMIRLHPSHPVAQTLTDYCRSTAIAMNLESRYAALFLEDDKVNSIAELRDFASEGFREEVLDRVEEYFDSLFTLKSRISPFYNLYLFEYAISRMSVLKKPQGIIFYTDDFYFKTAFHSTTTLVFWTYKKEGDEALVRAMVRCGFQAEGTIFAKYADFRYAAECRDNDELCTPLLNMDERLVQTAVTSIVHTFEELRQEYQQMKDFALDDLTEAERMLMAQETYTGWINGHHIDLDTDEKLESIWANGKQSLDHSLKSILNSGYFANMMERASGVPTVLILEALPPHLPATYEGAFTLDASSFQRRTPTFRAYHEWIPQRIKDQNRIILDSLFYFKNAEETILDEFEKTEAGRDFLQKQLNLTHQQLLSIHPALIIVFGQTAERYFKERPDRPHLNFVLEALPEPNVHRIHEKKKYGQLVSPFFDTKVYFFPKLADLSFGEEVEISYLLERLLPHNKAKEF